MTDASPARGMRDLLPAEKAQRETVLRIIRDNYLRYGYSEVETPALETLARLTAGQGGENEKLIYRVLRRGLTPEQLRDATLDDLCDLGLRFDLTLPLARFYAAHRARLPRVFRCLQIGPVWRAERPQKGRYRQFVQCDIDVLGEPSFLAEAELITATTDTLQQLGLTELTVRLNDRRLLIAMLTSHGVPAEEHGRALVTIDKLDKLGVAGVTEELHRVLSPEAAKSLTPLIEAIAEPEFTAEALRTLVPSPDVPDLIAGLDQITAAVHQATSGQTRIRFDASLVRGMGYYTGPIFEIWHPGSGSAIAGGGRYDGMIGRFLGQDVPATGFSIGFERIMTLIDPAALPQDRARVVVLLYPADAAWSTVLSVQQKLLDEGARVRLVERPRRLGPLLDSLVTEGFRELVEIAPDGTVFPPRPLH